MLFALFVLCPGRFKLDLSGKGVQKHMEGSMYGPGYAQMGICMQKRFGNFRKIRNPSEI